MALIFEQAPCACKEFCGHSFRETIGSPDQLFPAYSSVLSDVDARQIAADCMAHINSDFIYLSLGWQQFGKSIANKWRKLSGKKRRELLLKVEKDFPEQEWFSFAEHSGSIDFDTPEAARGWRQCFLNDYMCIENLEGDPMRLLTLFQNRAQFSPQAWAPYDNLCLEYPWISHKAEVNFSSLCMIMGDSSHGAYGELTAWELGAAHRGELIGFPRAQLLLEMQELLYNSLARIMEKLGEGYQAGTTSASTESFKLEMTNWGRVDLCSTYTNQPHSPPPLFDIKLMASKAQAQVNLYSDRLWLLQTDSAYLRDSIEIAKGALSAEHTPFEKYREAAVMIPLDIWHYWSWRSILNACQNVEQVQREFVDNIQPGQPLPNNYEKVLQELEVVLKAHTESRLSILFKALSEQPAFRKYFTEVVLPSDQNDQGAISGVAGISGLTVPSSGQGRGIALFVDYVGQDLLLNDPLFYGLQTLASPNVRRRGLVDTAIRWAYLEEVLNTHHHEDVARLDGELFEMYNSFAAADELYFALQFHQPKPAPTLDMEQPRYTREQAAELRRPTVLSYDADKIFEQKYRLFYNLKAPELLKNFVEAYDRHLKDPRFDDQKRLKQIDDIRAARQAYWQHDVETRRGVLEKSGNWTKEEILQDIAIISAHENPENFRLEEAERKKVEDRIAYKLRPKHASQLTPGTPSEWEQPTPEKELPSIKGKEKLKTRPEESNPVIPDIEPLALTPTDPKRPELPVTKKTLDLLTKMLSTGDEKIKDVDWNNFVSAMVDVGFAATQTTGSMVDFQPVENHPLGWKGRIVLHRPHPAAKIHKIMLRAYGKRFARRFGGWEVETFVERRRDE